MHLRNTLTVAALSSAMGCGSVVYGTDATGNNDSGGDAARSTIQVKVTSHAGDGAALDATVVSTDANGNLIAEIASGPAGAASISIVAGGSVHVIEPTLNGIDRITSIVGVQAGDTLNFGLARRPVQLTGPSETIGLAYPSLPAGVAYGFFTPCGGEFVSGQPTKLSLQADCHGPSYPILAIGNGRGIAVYNFQVVAARPGDTVTIPAWTNLAPFSVFYANAGAELSSLITTRFTMVGERALAPLAAAFGDPPTGDFSATVNYPPAVGAQSVLRADLGRADAVGKQQINIRTATLSSSLGVDLAVQPLPWIATVPAAVATGASWTQVGTGTPDLRQSDWAGSWLANSVAHSVQWTVYDTSSAPELVLPVLPSKFAAVDPRGQQLTAASTNVTYYDFSTLTPAALRVAPESLTAGFDNNTTLSIAAMVVRTSSNR